jgi:methylmalonyl-CoA mutase
VVLKQLNEGVIKEKFRKSADKEQELLTQEKKSYWELINTQTRRQDETGFRIVSFCKSDQEKIITPIIEKRLAEKVEQERLDLENSVEHNQSTIRIN